MAFFPIGILAAAGVAAVAVIEGADSLAGFRLGSEPGFQGEGRRLSLPVFARRAEDLESALAAGEGDDQLAKLGAQALAADDRLKEDVMRSALQFQFHELLGVTRRQRWIVRMQRSPGFRDILVAIGVAGPEAGLGGQLSIYEQAG